MSYRQKNHVSTGISSPRIRNSQLQIRVQAVDVRNVFPKFAANHLLSNLDILVFLAVVDGEAQADKVGQDGSGSLLGADRGRVDGGREGAREWKTK